MIILSTPWICPITVGVPWLRVTGMVTKSLTPLNGCLWWKLLSWLPSFTGFSDKRGFGWQSPHAYCLTCAPFGLGAWLWLYSSCWVQYWKSLWQNDLFFHTWSNIMSFLLHSRLTWVRCASCWHCFWPACGKFVLHLPACLYSNRLPGLSKVASLHLLLVLELENAKFLFFLFLGFIYCASNLQGCIYVWRHLKLDLLSRASSSACCESW
jgi:hypothetical protein